MVKDEHRIRRLLVDTLQEAGYDVIEAENEAEGLDNIYREHPDIILLDVIMPAMDGFQVLERLRDDAAILPIPVMMVTVKGREQDLLKAKALGASDYISKPWLPNEVESKVMNIVAGMQRLSDGASHGRMPR